MKCFVLICVVCAFLIQIVENKKTCPSGQLSDRICSLEILVDNFCTDNSLTISRLDDLEAENTAIKSQMSQLTLENSQIRELLEEISHENLALKEQLGRVMYRLDVVEETLLELTTRPCSCWSIIFFLYEFRHLYALLLLITFNMEINYLLPA